MGRKLFVGNLPFSVNDESLRTLFAEAGAVASAQVIMDKFSGRSKGFGFVEMSSDEEAAKAISQLNGREIEGRALTVNEARPQAPREGGFGGGGGRGDRGGGGGGGYGGKRGRSW